MITPGIKETITENSYTLESGNGNSLEIKKVMRGVFIFNHFNISNDLEPGIIKLFREKLFNHCKLNSIMIGTDDLENNRPIIEMLEASGFKIKYSKILFEKNLEEHTYPIDDIFEYKSIEEIGLNKYLEVFKKVVDDDPEREVAHEVFFYDMIELAEEKFDPRNWKVVVLDKRYIGIISPQIYPDNEKLGSVYYLGLIPEARNKGYGKIIHSKCLDILKELGAKKYIGSTNTNNEPMCRVFESNGCKKLLKRIVYITN
jgi:RimJ/RimL family protein N-acetyltransferase